MLFIKKYLKIIFTILCVINILFIFFNSLMTADSSSSSSAGVRAFINDVLKKIHIPFSFTDHFVRKAAHFTEFMILGILLTITILLFSKPNIFMPLFVGLFTAVVDEFIQLFIDGRSGQVSDVVLDFSGLVFGIGLVLLINYIKKRRKAL